MNTNMHVTRDQASSMLKAVRFAIGTHDDQYHAPSLPTLTELRGNESMLLAALERIRDLEARRAAR